MSSAPTSPFSCTLDSEQELDRFAAELLKWAASVRIFAFYAEMGVGKTTVIKKICESLGVKDTMSSPSFSIVNHYISGNGENIYHFDFYRLRKEEEAYELGLEEYFDSGAYCFIEWPEKIINLLPEPCIRVKMDTMGQKRVITATYA